MRLALLHYTHSPVIGGVERVIRDQAAAMRALGHEVDLFDRSADAMVRFRNWLDSGSAHPSGSNAGAGAPVVIVHNVFTMPFDLEWTRELSALAASMPHICWVNWVHDVAAVNPHYAHVGWREPVPAALHVAVSEVRRQDFARATGLDPESIRVIPNGLDFTAVLDLSARISALRLWQHEIVLAHPTRLIRRKNIELGIRTTAALHQSGSDVIYAITGAPDPHQADGRVYHAELKKLAEDLGIAERVLFIGETGPLSDHDVRSLYVTATALFFPSTGEGFGLPLLEAQAHRLPVFCSDLAVHHEVLGEAGCFFSAESKAEEISAQIKRWLHNDTVTRQRRQLWRDHDMVKICQEHLEPLLLTATAIIHP